MSHTTRQRALASLSLIVVLTGCISELEQLRARDPDTAATIEFLCSSLEYPASLATPDSSVAFQNESECQKYYARQANNGEPRIIPVPAESD